MKRYAEFNGVKDSSLAFVNQANLGQISEKKFIIHASWWRKWCDYVNFSDFMELGSTIEM